jgi:hypothetical protein
MDRDKYQGKGAKLLRPAGVSTLYGELDPSFHDDQNPFPALPKGRVLSNALRGSFACFASATER